MKNIVLIAHDAKKPEMVKFLDEHKNWIPNVNLIATGRTAEFIEKKEVKVKHLSPGAYGGYNQITEMIAKKEVDLVIFLRDPKIISGYHEDIVRLLQTCNEKNIPLATNYASAELLILGLIKKEATERQKNK